MVNCKTMEQQIVLMRKLHTHTHTHTPISRCRAVARSWSNLCQHIQDWLGHLHHCCWGQLQLPYSRAPLIPFQLQKTVAENMPWKYWFHGIIRGWTLKKYHQAWHSIFMYWETCHVMPCQIIKNVYMKILTNGYVIILKLSIMQVFIASAYHTLSLETYLIIWDVYDLHLLSLDWKPIQTIYGHI